MNKSLLFKNAILNLYKAKIYTVDFAILVASDYADRNKINASDSEELLTYLAEEQAKEMANCELKEIEETEGTDEDVGTLENPEVEVIEENTVTGESKATSEAIDNENTEENVEE